MTCLANKFHNNHRPADSAHGYKLQAWGKLGVHLGNKPLKLQVLTSLARNGKENFPFLCENRKFLKSLSVQENGTTCCRDVIQREPGRRSQPVLGRPWSREDVRCSSQECPRPTDPQEYPVSRTWGRVYVSVQVLWYRSRDMSPAQLGCLRQQRLYEAVASQP